MSASTLGAALLGEVEEETLDDVRDGDYLPLMYCCKILRRIADPFTQLLQSLRCIETPATSQLGFLPLDRLLNVFQNPPQSRQQQRHHTHFGESSPQSHNAYSTKDLPLPVIEITGAGSCSGKTQLLYLLVSTFLLPQNFKEVVLYGKGSAVVLLDLSGKFSIARLCDVMQQYIAGCSVSATLQESDILCLVSETLIHLHIYHPHSTSSLLGTLIELPQYLFGQPPVHMSSNRSVGLLAISDLSTFLWQDRLDADEEAGPYASNRAEKANNSLVLQRYRNLVSSLRRIQHQLSCTIIATNWSLAPITTSFGQRILRSHLPSSWTQFCTLKVIVSRESIRKFGPGMSVEEATKEAEQRQNAVENSGFSGSINWSGSDDWREEIREAIRNLASEGGFSFQVTDQGVLPEVEET